jgi:hypothetical protein
MPSAMAVSNGAGCRDGAQGAGGIAGLTQHTGQAEPGAGVSIIAVERGLVVTLGSDALAPRAGEVAQIGMDVGHLRRQGQRPVERRCCGVEPALLQLGEAQRALVFGVVRLQRRRLGERAGRDLGLALLVRGDADHRVEPGVARLLGRQLLVEPARLAVPALAVEGKGVVEGRGGGRHGGRFDSQEGYVLHGIIRVQNRTATSA